MAETNPTMDAHFERFFLNRVKPYIDDTARRLKKSFRTDLRAVLDEIEFPACGTTDKDSDDDLSGDFSHDLHELSNNNDDQSSMDGDEEYVDSDGDEDEGEDEGEDEDEEKTEDESEEELI